VIKTNQNKQNNKNPKSGFLGVDALWLLNHPSQQRSRTYMRVEEVCHTSGV